MTKMNWEKVARDRKAKAERYDTPSSATLTRQVSRSLTFGLPKGRTSVRTKVIAVRNTADIMAEFEPTRTKTFPYVIHTDQATASPKGESGLTGQRRVAWVPVAEFETCADADRFEIKLIKAGNRTMRSHRTR